MFIFSLVGGEYCRSSQTLSLVSASITPSSLPLQGDGSVGRPSITWVRKYTARRTSW